MMINFLRRTRLSLDVASTLSSGILKMQPTKEDLKRKRTMDDVLRDVIDEALAARDRGENPTSDFVYKRTQERMYEAEHGRPPPSKDKQYLSHIPPEPKQDLRRLAPTNSLFDEDPWPQPCFSAFQHTQNFVRDVYGGGGRDDNSAPAAGAAAAISGNGASASVPEGADREELVRNFSDAVDELGYWELQYVKFLRGHSLGLRRALPLLVEQYKMLTHRLIRAERRLLAARDRAVGLGLKLDPKDYAGAETWFERVRKIYSETHKSLAQTSYDPTRMNRTVTGPLLKMNEEEFEKWIDECRVERDRITLAFEQAPSEPIEVSTIDPVEAPSSSSGGASTEPKTFEERMETAAQRSAMEDAAKKRRAGAASSGAAEEVRAPGHIARGDDGPSFS